MTNSSFHTYLRFQCHLKKISQDVFYCALITIWGHTGMWLWYNNYNPGVPFYSIKNDLSFGSQNFALIFLFCGFLSMVLLPHPGWCIELWHRGWVSEINCISREKQFILQCELLMYLCCERIKLYDVYWSCGADGHYIKII